jgi:pimeloyl-ACP methyl ester carboxylesterase
MKAKALPRIAVNERRAYFECQRGQLHVRTAFPSTGGFDERTPLICLHDIAASSAAFAGLVTELAGDRSIYAIDLPGHGETDPVGARADVGAYAEVVGDLIRALRLREIDVLGHGFGAVVAAELAALRDGTVKSLVLIDAPVDGGSGCPEWSANESGHGLEETFRAVRGRAPGGESIDSTLLRFTTVLRDAAGVARANDALAAWPMERWRQVRHRALAFDFVSRRAAVAEQLHTGRSLDGSNWSADILRTGDGDLVGRLRAFLDAPG